MGLLPATSEVAGGAAYVLPQYHPMASSTGSVLQTRPVSGSLLVNLTDGSRCIVTNFNDNGLTCEAGLEGGKDSWWHAGDRYELLNMALANKKIALEAQKFTPEQDPERYWRNQLILRNAERKFVVNDHLARLEIPEMSALAEERYLTNPDKYALIKESRMSSHILFRCAPPECDRDERKKEASLVLEQLESGASFESLAAQYSEDPGSKDNGGKFDRWLQKNTQKVDPHYLQEVFAIEAAGQHSGLADSSFGIHIIRLDEIKEDSYRPFAEVRGAVIADLEYEYKKLAALEFDARFRLTDKTYINKEAMEAIFLQYQAEDVAPAE